MSKRGRGVQRIDYHAFDNNLVQYYIRVHRKFSLLHKSSVGFVLQKPNTENHNNLESHHLVDRKEE